MCTVSSSFCLNDSIFQSLPVYFHCMRRCPWCFSQEPCVNLEKNRKPGKRQSLTHTDPLRLQILCCFFFFLNDFSFVAIEIYSSFEASPTAWASRKEEMWGICTMYCMSSSSSSSSIRSPNVPPNSAQVWSLPLLSVECTKNSRNFEIFQS